VWNLPMAHYSGKDRSTEQRRALALDALGEVYVVSGKHWRI